MTVDARAGFEIYDGVSLLIGGTNLTGTTYVNHLNARNPFTQQPIAEPGCAFFANISLAF